MTLGLMQPYFFPYIGYFDLINRTDEWIVFDNVQYIQRGWVNRNRMLHPNTGWQYIIVPLEKHHRDTPIKDIRISRTEWVNRIIGQLQHYRTRAPHYRAVLEVVRAVLDPSEISLSRLNVTALAAVCGYLSISFRPRIFSEMDIQLGAIESPGDWALQICRARKATGYLNPPGGTGLYDPEVFARNGIRLQIQEAADFRYDCAPYQFEPALSILDVMMWNEPAAIKRWLDGRREPEARTPATAAGMSTDTA
jgi:hypothetical protein